MTPSPYSSTQALHVGLGLQLHGVLALCCRRERVQQQPVSERRHV